MEILGRDIGRRLKMNIVELLGKLENFGFLGPIDNEKINEAEKKLGLVFAEDYKQYISTYGIASFGSHELTGICSSKRLNVVSVTNKYKAEKNIFDNLYVIEDIGIDGIVIWQSSTGEIFQSEYDFELKKIFNSLAEYVEAYK